MLVQEHKNAIRNGLVQFNDEALGRIRDHEGPMLLDGHVFLDEVG